MRTLYDVIIIGAGPAGLAAGIEAKKNGADCVLIIDRDREPGGILPQCIHNGFGSVIFEKDYPGPYYAQKFIDEALSNGVEFLLDTMVLDVVASKKIFATNSKHGYLKLEAKAVVFAMGCRERTRAQIKIPGSRPAGVFTAGLVQRFVNIEGYMPGKKFVILGSGDIGMIMARRLTLEGAKVERVIEIMPFLTGLKRNYVQCLQDFDIPLNLQHTVNRIIGKDRLEAVEIIKVDDALNPVPGSTELIPCDALLLSVGLIPEIELVKKAGIELDPVIGGPVVDQNMAAGIPGFYAAGNIVNISDLVDFVSELGSIAGQNAANFAKKGKQFERNLIEVLPGVSIRSMIPRYLDLNNIKDRIFMIQLRVTIPFEKKIKINLIFENRIIQSFRENYARPAEMIVLRVDGNKILEAVSDTEAGLKIEIQF